MNTRKVGEKIRELRGKESQGSLARKVGISKSAIAMYERGERVPRDEVKIRLSGYFGVPISDIFFAD